MASPPTGPPVTLARVSGTLVAGALPVLLTVTTVSVAVDPIATRYAVTAGTVHWVATGYLLAIAAVIPTLPWLVGRLGIRRVWFGALWVFLVGSLLCAAAWSLGSLIVFRVVQGLGGGLVLPLLQTILAQRAGPTGFARAMALVSVPGQLVPIVGPLVGGLLVDGPGWRSVFVLSVPLTVTALLLARSGLPDGDATARAHPLDVIGLLLAVPGLVALLYALSMIGQDGHLLGGGGWLLAGAGLLAAYVVRGRTRGRPALVDLGLLRHQRVRAATAVTLMLGVCLWGSLLLLPLYLQQARGAGGTATGLLLAPQGLGTLVGLVAVGRLLEQFGPRRVTVAGLLVAAAATVPFALAGLPPSNAVLATALFVRGLGLGVAGVPALSTAYSSLPPSDAPAATSLVSIAQRLGAAVGTAVLSVVLDALLRQGLGAATAFGGTFTWTALLTLLAAALATRLPARVDAPRRPRDGAHQPLRHTRSRTVSHRPDRIDTVLIVGSTREGRFGPTVAAWVADQARRRQELDVEVLDLADAGLPATLPRVPDQHVRRFAARLGRADAVIVVTPEYNHGYPASLKQAIDLVREEWAAKPIALVSYGGLGGGLRAVEQLRLVFAELEAVTVRDTVSFHTAHEQFRPDGSLDHPDDAEAAAATLFDRLVWWARVLRRAQEVHPYAS